MRSDRHTDASPSVGRRERNKEAKQARIFAAAAELFAEHGFAAVTTQQIAERADVANGTLFRYASTKAELLLMVCNDDFRMHLDHGRRLAVALPHQTGGAQGSSEPIRRILALLTPLILAGRRSNATTADYQREILFGQPTERYRAEALELVAELQDAIADILSAAQPSTSEADPTLAARAVSNVLHLELARATLANTPMPDFLTDLAAQIELITRGYLARQAREDPAQPEQDEP